MKLAGVALFSASILAIASRVQAEIRQDRQQSGTSQQQAGTSQSQGSQQSPSGAQPQAAGSEQTPTPAAPPPGAGATYIIQPGDVLEVQVWKETEVSKQVPVRPDGKISLPLINDVQAAGLTAAQLTSDLSEKFKKFISEPQVTVIVTQVNSQRIYVMGEVARGGTYPLLPGMSVLQGLSDAGGFTPFANPKKIYVLRDQGGKQLKLPFNYNAVVKGKAPEQNVPLMAGDTIVVP
jgi:polysaccharide export outer membrane protein